MKLRRKIILFALTPLILALGMIAFTVNQQAVVLGKEQRGVIEPAYLATKEGELKSYVMVARHAIDHLHESGRTDDNAMAEMTAIFLYMILRGICSCTHFHSPASPEWLWPAHIYHNKVRVGELPTRRARLELMDAFSGDWEGQEITPGETVTPPPRWMEKASHYLLNKYEYSIVSFKMATQEKGRMMEQYVPIPTAKTPPRRLTLPRLRFRINTLEV